MYQIQMDLWNEDWRPDGQVVKKWYSAIAYASCAQIGGSACESKLKILKRFLVYIKGIQNHFSTPREQWQNEPAE